MNFVGEEVYVGSVPMSRCGMLGVGGNARSRSGRRRSVVRPDDGETIEDWFDPGSWQRFRPDQEADINVLIGIGAALAGWKHL